MNIPNSASDQKPRAWLTVTLWTLSILLLVIAIYLNHQTLLSIIVVVIELSLLQVANLQKAKHKNLFSGICILLISGLLYYTITDYTRIRGNILKDLKLAMTEQNKDFTNENGNILESMDSAKAAKTLHDFHIKVRDSLFEEKELKRFFRNKYEDKIEEWSRQAISAYLSNRNGAVKTFPGDNNTILLLALNRVIDAKSKSSIEHLCNSFGITDKTTVKRVYEDTVIAAGDLGSLKDLLAGIAEGFDSHIRFKKITDVKRDKQGITNIEFINGQ